MQTLTQYQRKLHRLICQAVIDSLEGEKEDKCEQIKQYFKRAGQDISIGFCFCPDNESIKDIMNYEKIKDLNYD